MTSRKTQKNALHAGLALLSMSAACGAGAQTQTQTQAPPPCTSAESRQFDFWVGDWEAHFTQNGKPGQSRNKVTRILGDCVIFEDFRGAPDSPLYGMSHSVFDRQAGKWKQTWVDNNASYLDFVGEFKDDRMILSRTAAKDGKTFLQRMVWFDIQPDRFNWHWERSDDGGKTWQVNWKIDYRRVK
jgi:hypothetical protein